MFERFRISKKKRAVLETLKTTQYLGKINSMDVKNKDIFLYALALGKDIPSDLEGADQWFEKSDMDETEKAIVYSVAYDVLNDVDKLLDFETLRNVVDRMSNSGLDVLAEKMDSESLDNAEKKMIMELNEVYEELNIE
jgi:hypothetical protein